MAINPLAARGRDENTLSMTDLLRVPVRDRVTAAKTSSSFVEMLLTSLTPIQIAQAFPDYYRDAIPDVSNFITKNIEAKLAAAGRGWDQTEGGDPGTARPGYTGESKTGRKKGGKSDTSPTPVGTPPPTFEEMKAKLLEKGIDIDNIRDVVTEKGALAGDKRIAALKKLSKEELAKAGFEKVETEEGKTLIRETATQASQMSDEDVLSKVSGTVAPGTEGLKGKQKLQKQVYDSFINAGFSDRQAVALTAEVGRENDFNESTLFGSHIDSNNGKVNLGTFSWQGDRRPELLKYLKEQGVLDKNGQMIPGQEALDAMARYAKLEMETVPGYKATREKFLNNPNVDAATAAQVLGKNFISWDMTGKYGLRNPQEHAAKRDRYYQELIELNKKFPGIIPENATADQIEEARQKLIQEEEAARQTVLAETLYEQESPTSSEATEQESPTSSEATEQESPTSSEATVDASTSSLLGFAPGEEETYLGGINKIGAIPTAGESEGSREFGKVYTDPETGKQYPIRGGAGHAGTDFGDIEGYKTGTPWKAHMGGEVLGSGYNGSGYGYYIDVQFDDGSIHRYAHNDENIARAGRFEKGKVLFKVGATGVKSGWAHVHNEVWLPKKINGVQYTAKQLYDMSAGKFSKTPEGLLYRSNPREYWQNYEQQQLALREKYTALQERIKEDPKTINDISESELSLLAEHGQDLYPELSEAARKKIEDGTRGIQTATPAPESETDSIESLSDADYETLNSMDFKSMSDDELQVLLEENEEKIKGKKPGELKSEDYLPLNVAARAKIELRDRQDLKEQRAKTIYIGDSIAQGLATEQGKDAHAMSLARKGLSPSKVLEKIKDLDPKTLKGKNIVLSSGISNAPTDLETVEETLRYLKESGANVTLAGTGTRKDLAPLNEPLRELSEKYGASFLGGFEATDEVHPNYKEYLKKVNESLIRDVQLERFRESQQQAESATIEKPVVDRREELGIGPDVTGEGLVLSSQDPEKYGDSIEKDRSQALREPSIEEIMTRKSDNQSTLNSLGDDATPEQRAALKAEIEKDKLKIEELSDAEPAPMPEEEPQKMAQGGFINEKDNLSVVNEEGKTLAKINEGEMVGGMLTEGTGMRIVSNRTRLADDIVERNNIESPIQQTAMTLPDAISQTQREKIEGLSKNKPMPEDQNWREMTANDSHQRGTQIRAFRRTKFMPEGYHFNRASPASIA